MTEEEKKALADKLAKEAQEKENQKTPEQLRQELENKNKAIEEERSKRKSESTRASELEAKLAKYEKAEQEKLEADAIAKGEFDKILAEHKAKIAEYEPIVNEHKEFISKSKAETEAKVNEYLTKIPATELDFVKMAIDGKDWVSQVKLLEWFMTKFKIPTFSDDKIEEKKKEDINWKWDKKAELYAKIKWWTASPSEKSEYIALLRAK